MKTQTNQSSDFLISITNRETDTTFAVPVSYPELAQIIQGVALYDNRIGGVFDGITGQYEEYFDLIKPSTFTNQTTLSKEEN